MLTKTKKKLFFISLSSILLVGVLIGAIVGTRKRSSHQHHDDDVDDNSAAHVILKSSCSMTRYPELCYSAIASVPESKAKLTCHKDVIEASVNLTIASTAENFHTIKKLANRKSLTEREKTALHDCLEMVDETLDELRIIEKNLKEYPNNKKLPKQDAEELNLFLSAAMTNQESCIDGFSHEDADKKVREELLKGQLHVERMCSNSLAMIKNLTANTDIHNYERRNLGSTTNDDDDGSGFPSWLSVGDRRLLQAPTVTADVTVAADGSGNFKTIAAAVAAAPEKSSKRYVIKIKAGVYRENVEVPKKKTFLMFVGDGRKNTIVTGSRNVKDGSTTFHSATVAVVGNNFLARDITFENTAGASKHQAVALRVGSDLSAFYRCDILAYQDTLYVHSLRQFFTECLVAGTVDFIFGNAAVVLQNCDLHARRPNSGQKNMFTAQGRTDPNQNTGIVIQKCRIGATSDLAPVISSFPSYLGRPWKEYSRTIVMQSAISNVINPAGWHEWTGNFALNTLFYAEYQNTGPGAGGAQAWTRLRLDTTPGHRRGCALACALAHPLPQARASLDRFLCYEQGCALARARPRLGRFLGHEQGNTLADSFGTSKTAPWHEQGISRQELTKLDLGIDQVKRETKRFGILLKLALRISSAVRVWTAGSALEIDQPSEMYFATEFSPYCPSFSYAVHDGDHEYLESKCLTVSSSTFLSSVNSTLLEVNQVTSLVSKFVNEFGDLRVSSAINDCIDLLDYTADELSLSESAMKNSNAKGNSSGTGNRSSDLKTWLSAALGNLDTCNEGFEGTNSFVKNVIGSGVQQVSSDVANILRMLRSDGLLVSSNKSSTSGVTHGGHGSNGRRSRDNFPGWMRIRDRRLLQAPASNISADAVVALDGTGSYTSIMDAIAAAPEYSSRRYVIHVKRGLYKENVEIKKKKWNLMIIGDGAGATVISGNRNFIDGWTTFRSATFAVAGKGFIARDITIENTSGPEKHQAVAIRSDSDLSAYYRCSFLGFQDTLYAHSLRQFYRECTIAGTVDFIFGNAAAVFQNCLIIARKGLPNQKNTITAQGRKDPYQTTGFSIQFSNITASSDLLDPSSNPTYLGRPWKQYSRTVFMQSYMSSIVRPEGWLEWQGNFALDTLFYGEYMNYGAGAGLGGRVKWAGFHVIGTPSEANNYTVAQFIAGNQWLPATGVKFTSGLGSLRSRSTTTEDDNPRFAAEQSNDYRRQQSKVRCETEQRLPKTTSSVVVDLVSGRRAWATGGGSGRVRADLGARGQRCVATVCRNGRTEAIGVPVAGRANRAIGSAVVVSPVYRA
ncbi:hypothetical protein Syun_026687 [Stephania yunnanensis]|uniref:pectinesterase n=1 Tax=Stephania yunnanensis TaxID=152371 RepID=A0AAP0HVZ5_9MAGN